MIGRIGGEEFAAVAGGSGIEAGVALADRVRRAFGEAAQTVDGLAINGTLSAGVSGNAARRRPGGHPQARRYRALSGKGPGPQPGRGGSAAMSLEATNVVRIA